MAVIVRKELCDDGWWYVLDQRSLGGVVERIPDCDLGSDEALDRCIAVIARLEAGPRGIPDGLDCLFYRMFDGLLNQGVTYRIADGEVTRYTGN
jgi:hypothetical protein